MMTVRFRRIPTPQGRVPQLPRHATAGAAGADLTANIDAPLTLAPMARAVIPTGLAMELPDAGYGAFVFARSGLGIKHGLTLSNGVGVIDSDYRGEVSVGLVNLSDRAYTIQPGERIAQLCILPVMQFTAVEAEELAQTGRGTGGFGSTGRQ
ncbi:MAG: dUTP diphosphatase [Eubacteriales bacterium]|nr:dUTP diphosphatase [Eubacteriales bacterium]